jgi:hypothetical protein
MPGELAVRAGHTSQALQRRHIAHETHNSPGNGITRRIRHHSSQGHCLARRGAGGQQLQRDPAAAHTHRHLLGNTIHSDSNGDIAVCLVAADADHASVCAAASVTKPLDGVNALPPPPPHAASSAAINKPMASLMQFFIAC